jgi:hypothetical protein
MERIVAIGEAAGGFFEFRRQLDDKARLYGASVVSLKQDLLLLRFGEGRTGFVATRISSRALRIRGGSGPQRLRKILNDWPQALRCQPVERHALVRFARAAPNAPQRSRNRTAGVSFAQLKLTFA